MVSQLNTEQLRAQDYPLDDILAKAAEARDFVVQVKPSKKMARPSPALTLTLTLTLTLALTLTLTLTRSSTG